MARRRRHFPTVWMAVQFGADAVGLTQRHAIRRALNDAAELSPLDDYRARGLATSAHAQLSFTGISRLVLSPGVRIDRWGPTSTSSSSPWGAAELRLSKTTRLRAAGGTYRQFADLEQINGVRGGGANLRPEWLVMSMSR